jgi:hypothetical protein
MAERDVSAPRDAVTMDQRLVAYAVQQGGVLSWACAQRFSVRPAELAAWAAAGEVVRVRRNAYVLGSCWHTAEPDERNRLRVQAVINASDGWAASHQSALALHALPVHEMSMTVLDVIARVRELRLAAGVRRHPLGENPHRVLVDGHAAVPIPWAIAQVALRQGVLPALVALDRALHAERTCREDVRAAGFSLATGGEDARPIERILALADPKCESVGETLTRVLLLDLGYQPRSQVVINDPAGRFVARVDFLLENGVVVEFDGAVKYAGTDKDEVLDAQDRREQRIRARGHGVARLAWGDLRQPEVVLAKIRAEEVRMRAAG